MGLKKLLIIIMMAASVILGGRLLYGAFLVLFRLEELYPEITEMAPDFIAEARSAMPFDIISGLLLIFWPFYAGWLRTR
jgi:hypothetical protein